ncbi:hypothetical protein BH11PSE8_BH11PSE8_27600 [soil metagenome]
MGVVANEHSPCSRRRFHEASIGAGKIFLKQIYSPIGKSGVIPRAGEYVDDIAAIDTP